MSYAVLRSDKANDELFAIIQYITQDAGNIDIALHYLDALEGEIRKLATAPHIGSYPRYGILKKQGYRVLTVQRHLIFYKVDDEKHQVMIYVASEFAVLLAEKKTAYADYRLARDSMREIQTVKANVQKILMANDNEQLNEKDKSR